MSDSSHIGERNNVFKTFLKNYHQVVKFTVESIFDKFAYSDDEFDEKDHLLIKPYNFDETDFEELYVARQVEDKLKKEIRLANDYLCFVAPKGGGKTTTGKKIQIDLLKSTEMKTHVVFLDIRLLKSSLKLDNPENFRSTLAEKVIVNYLERLFPLNDEKGIFERVKLWEYILKLPPNNQLPQEYRSDFENLQQEIGRDLKIFRDNADNRANATLYEYLNCSYTNSDVWRITQEIRKNLNIYHLAYAARDILGFRRQIIWFDNTDALPDNLQSEVINVVRSFHHEVNNVVSTVVAIREENVFREEDPFEEATAPPFRKPIKLKKDDGKFLDAVDLPMIKNPTLESIVEKRLKLTFSKLKKHNNQYSSRLSELQIRIDETSDTKEKAQLEADISEYQNYLGDCEPLLIDKEFDDLKTLSKNTMKMLQDNMVIHLSNNSLREFLRVHRDVLKHVLENADWDMNKALDYPTWYLSTLFYNWLGITDKDHQIPTYNIVRESENWKKNGGEGIGCVLSYLVITTIWNLTLEKKVVRGRNTFVSPLIGEVVKRLKILGYTREAVIDNLYELHIGHSRGNILDFRLKGTTTRENLSDDTVVYLMPRGRCLVSLSCNTFGFFYEDVISYEKSIEKITKTEPLEVRKAAVYLEKILPHLCSVAQMHYDALRKFRDESNLQPKEWFEQYCKFFGTPQKPPYKRQKEIGSKLLGDEIKRALQFEALISSISSYDAGGLLHFQKTRKMIKTLEDKFISAILNLGKTGDPAEIDFCSEVNLVKA